MTSSEADHLAADYVLGALDAETRARVHRRLGTEAELRGAVTAWERRLSVLSVVEAPLTPPAGLWDRIAPKLDHTLQDGRAVGITVRAGDGVWEPFAAGVDKKSLLVDPINATESFLLRFAPGAFLAGHDHRLVEECLMLDGDIEIGELPLRAGDFHAIGGDSTHPEIRSRAGGLLYVRGELRTAAG